ncbi:MAG: cysteine dioxygenase family protein [Thermoanaerobaculia bacterium]|nr:cysteine dioxygenase family protein [Thermoanaerobaculia bacterium]
MSQSPTIPPIPGLDRLVEDLDRATAFEDRRELSREVKETLERHTEEQTLILPPEIQTPAEDSYARRLLHLDPEGRYSLLAMVWGPDQGTPLHDHAGMWCVEGVYHGEIDVCQFELKERDNGRFRFEAGETVRAGLGDAGALIPPFEYHTIANPHSDRSAMTLHVYGGEMTECTVFEPVGDGWYRRETKELGYD